MQQSDVGLNASDGYQQSGLCLNTNIRQILEDDGSQNSFGFSSSNLAVDTDHHSLMDYSPGMNPNMNMLGQFPEVHSNLAYNKETVSQTIFGLSDFTIGDRNCCMIFCVLND